MNCEQMVASAAPRIPQFSTKIKIGARIMLQPTVSMEESIAFFRVTGGTHDVVESDHDIRNRTAQQNYLHKIAGIRQGSFAGSEEKRESVPER